jgi:hypothetical protein
MVTFITFPRLRIRIDKELNGKISRKAGREVW